MPACNSPVSWCLCLARNVWCRDGQAGPVDVCYTQLHGATFTLPGLHCVIEAGQLWKGRAAMLWCCKVSLRQSAEVIAAGLHISPSHVAGLAWQLAWKSRCLTYALQAWHGVPRDNSIRLICNLHSPPLQGIDVKDCKFNIVSPGADPDIYFPYTEEDKRKPLKVSLGYSGGPHCGNGCCGAALYLVPKLQTGPSALFG